MTPPEDDPRQAVALFRYGLIAPLLSEPRPGKLIRQLAEKRYVIPGSRRSRIAPSTLYDWLRTYRQFGFEGLMPRRRADSARPRRMPPEAIEILLAIKRRTPELSVRAVIKAARDGGEIPDDQPLPPSTIHRLFSREGLMTPANPGHDRRRFAYEAAGELWMSDVLHGPRAGDRGRRRKTYLIALIDDCTRVVPFAGFAFSENTAAFLPVFREALLRRGLPKRLYVDNGASYRSQQLALVCARLGIALIHARPYHPAGKGKIERWLRTVRQQFLPTLGSDDLHSLEALNRRLHAWTESEYHYAPHRGLDGLTPLDKWAATADGVRYPAPGLDLEDLFLFEARRRVNRDRTVSLRTRVYEVDPVLVGRTVTLRFDPERPTRPLKVVCDGKPAGEATPIDLHGNARVRRNTLSFHDPDTED